MRSTRANLRAALDGSAPGGVDGRDVRTSYNMGGSPPQLTTSVEGRVKHEARAHSVLLSGTQGARTQALTAGNRRHRKRSGTLGAPFGARTS